MFLSDLHALLTSPTASLLQEGRSMRCRPNEPADSVSRGRIWIPAPLGTYYSDGLAGVLGKLTILLEKSKLIWTQHTLEYHHTNLKLIYIVLPSSGTLPRSWYANFFNQRCASTWLYIMLYILFQNKAYFMILFNVPKNNYKKSTVIITQYHGEMMYISTK